MSILIVVLLVQMFLLVDVAAMICVGGMMAKVNVLRQ